jgi:hypothetical protein
MNKIYHKPIKRFHLDGKIHDDADLVRLKMEYVKLVLDQMRMSGYVPKFDIDTDFTIEYNHKKEYFEFELSIYAVFVGKKKSKWILGIHGNQVIHSHQNKPKGSLLGSESTSKLK